MSIVSHIGPYVLVVTIGNIMHYNNLDALECINRNLWGGLQPGLLSELRLNTI